MLVAGIDIGSSAVKIALMEERPGEQPRVLVQRNERIRRRDPQQVVGDMFEQCLAEANLSRDQFGYIATTGEGELVDFRTGHFYSMTTHSVLGYRMTSQCASGSGQFLENICRYLGVTIDEIGPLSIQAENPETCSSICAVLAETDVINMVSRGISTPDIIKGIHQSMAGRYLKLISSVGAREVVLVTGGLATDVGLLAAMREGAEAQQMPVEIRAHPDSVLAGAFGAALWGAFRARRLAERAERGRFPNPGFGDRSRKSI
jgi:benzoyl-CoA reductase subunit D